MQPSRGLVPFVCACLFAGYVPVSVHAGSDQDAAWANRVDAAARAKAQLGYQSHEREEVAPAQTDYDALSQQIERLADIVERMQHQSHGDGLLLQGVASGPAQRERLFGSQGPSVASVSALLRYRIAVSGNSNLQLGTITDQGPAIEAAVVTRDGSLVERYHVDKASGEITLANE